MPNNPINKVVYGNDVLMDLTGDTVEPATLVLGTTAHDRSGAAITGTFDPSIYVEKAGDTMTGPLQIVSNNSFIEVRGDNSQSGPISSMSSGSFDSYAYVNGSAAINAKVEYNSIRVAYGSGSPSVSNSKTGVEATCYGALNIVYNNNGTYKQISLPNDLALSSGTATRDTTNASAGTCAWQKMGRVVTVVVTGVSLTADAANNSDIFTGLPAANEQTNCIAMGNTSGCTRWYVTTTGALRVGAMALRSQTIYLNFSYISAS